MRTSDLENYRAQEGEVARTNDLLSILPKGRRSVLDIGARDGHFSRLLTDHFVEVTALDLQKPDFAYSRVVTVAGDVTKLHFADESFDCVFCAEVLEHVSDLKRACAEVTRVARHEIIIGVPFNQDVRCGRTTCRSCCKCNPAWGHVNSFDEKRLCGLFPSLKVISKTFVGSSKEGTNLVSTFLMDLAGNPWGTYKQEERCVKCGAKLIPPSDERTWAQKVCSATANRINRLQEKLIRPHGNWIHLVLSKK